jgi:adenosylcobinamide-GDP ribazoletransferase
MIALLQDLAAAFQFLTRLPMGWLRYRGDLLRRAAIYFPLVGMVLGAAVVGLHALLSAHFSRSVAALLVVLFLTLMTGAMHEDGLADVADGFGGGWSREKILEIMKDSRVGSYGALAICFSVGARVLLLASLPAERFAAWVIAAETLSRWTALPLGAAIPSARQKAGQEASLGARIAGQIPWTSVLAGSVLALVPVLWLLRWTAWEPCVAALIVTAASGLYYRRRLGGVTGDCFGATIQLTAIAIYLCGAWQR